MGNSHLPFYAEAWSFETAPDTLDHQAKACARLFADARTIKRGLYLFGPVGSGKTSLAVSIIKAAMWRGEDAMFIRECDLIDRLRSAVARGSEDGDELLATAKAVRWLALDEIGMMKPTQYVLELLYKLVEARRSAGLYTVFTSNFNKDELENYWWPRDKNGQRIPGFNPGQRIGERIAEYCDGIRVHSPNLRRKQ